MDPAARVAELDAISTAYLIENRRHAWHSIAEHATCAFSEQAEFHAQAIASEHGIAYEPVLPPQDALTTEPRP